VAHISGDRHPESGGRIEEALVDGPGEFAGRGIAAVGGKHEESVQKSEDRAEETDEWGDVGQGREHLEIPLQSRDLEKGGIPGDGLEHRPLLARTLKSGLEDTRDRTPACRGLAKSLLHTAVADEKGKSPEKLTDPHRGGVQEEKPFQKDTQGHDTADHDDPKQRASFLHKFQHESILGVGRKAPEG
jgi:hypothetical protein